MSSILEQIKANTDTVLLAFSRGKDSLCAWYVLRDAGFRVVPFHQELVPGLRFVEQSLQYYEEAFQTHIYRVIHPNCYHWLRSLGQQSPRSARAVEILSLPKFKYEDVQHGVARTVGLPLNTWCAVGTRLADSPTRRNSLSKSGGINPHTRSFSPIAEYSKQDIIDTLKAHGAKLPVDYKLFGRSFDGIDHRYLVPLKEAFPDDYARVLELFPLAHLELTRAEFARKHGQAKIWKTALTVS